jgi:alkylation response protein AidB-like acyl-CoA dehydrogenase
MNLSQLDERQSLSDTLGRFLAHRYDIDTRQKIARNPQGYSLNRWQSFADLGAIATLLPAAHGGTGGSVHDITQVFEALGRALVLEPFLPTAVLAASALTHAGTPDQQSLLADVLDGTLIMSLAHQEDAAAQAFNRPGPVHTEAVREGAQWVLQGHKVLVPLGHQSELLVVSARTAGEPDDAHGVSLFVLPLDTPGVRVRPHALPDGSRVADVTLQGAVLPEHALLGPLHQGAPALMHALNRGMLAWCAEALGVMEVLQAQTAAHLQTRQQFGANRHADPSWAWLASVPSAAMQHALTQARSALEQATTTLDDDDDPAAREWALAHAQRTVGRVAAQVVQDSVELHGGPNRVAQLPLAHHVHHLMVIQRQLGHGDHPMTRLLPQGTGDTIAP